MRLIGSISLPLIRAKFTLHPARTAWPLGSYTGMFLLLGDTPMSRRRIDPQSIRNQEHYFNRYIAMEVQKDKVRQKAYDDFFCSLDEKMSEHVLPVQQAMSCNQDGTDLEAQLAAQGILSWIDYIESPALFKALRQLTKQQQLLLTYRFHYCLSQRETANLLGCTQTSVLRCERRLIRKLKKSMKV